MTSRSRKQVKMKEGYCSEVVTIRSGGWFNSYKQCSRKSVNEEDGKGWCKQHTPSLVKARYEEEIERHRVETSAKAKRRKRRMDEETACADIGDVKLLPTFIQAVVDLRNAQRAYMGIRVMRPMPADKEKYGKAVAAAAERVDELLEQLQLKEWINAG